MKLKQIVLPLIVGSMFLSGCTTTEKKVDDTQEEVVAVVEESKDVAVDGLDQKTLSIRTIYFSFDDSQVQQDFIHIINAHALYLKNNSSQRIVLEGHADERGSREYNVALGEQRAKSVYRIMKMQGVSDSQVQIVSYGEEKPAASGMNESSWQLNRRVEIAYQVR
ncbi:MAG: peptidoglycan-associated lipoprotein Pal [Methylococcales bacterium]|nr:peptidoglycan-associated lipoprotein Pal [Methylococcales bacterium]